MSRGSWAMRMARRLPAALTTPELVSPATTRSMPASISPGSTISSQISRPSGLSQGRGRSYWIAWRAMRSPVKRGSRMLAAPGMMPSLRAVGARQAAIDLVDVAEVALEIPHEGNVAVIEMREVDAGPEHAAALVFRVLHHAAAQHRHFARRVDEREVDADLHAVETGLVFGVEEARVLERDDRRLAAPFDRRAVKLDGAAAGELGGQRLGFRPRQQHGVAEMAARPLAAQHRGEKQALVDLEHVLVLLQEAVLAGDLLRLGHQPGHRARRRRDQVLDTHEARAAIGQRVVDRVGMVRQEARARRARPRQNGLRGGLLATAALRARRQAPEQAVRVLPEGGIARAVGGVIGGSVRLRLEPVDDVGAGLARRRQLGGIRLAVVWLHRIIPAAARSSAPPV